MEPIAWIVLATLISLFAAMLGLVALSLRPFKERRDAGKLYALVSLVLTIAVWPIYLWRAPATNVPNAIYLRSALFSMPSVIAALVYPWFGPRERRGFDVVQSRDDRPPPQG